MLKTGQWVFNNRAWLPLPLLLLAIFFPEYTVSKINFIIGSILILMGEFGRIWSIKHAGKITRGKKVVAHDLVTTGPFSYLRNPIYLSNILMYSGATLILGVPGLLPIVIIFFFVQYTLIIIHEESVLSKSFSKRYQDYKKVVSRWVPSIPNKKLIPKSREKNNCDLRDCILAEKDTIRSIVSIALIALLKYYVIKLF